MVCDSASLVSRRSRKNFRTRDLTVIAQRPLLMMPVEIMVQLTTVSG